MGKARDSICQGCAWFVPPEGVPPPPSPPVYDSPFLRPILCRLFRNTMNIAYSRLISEAMQAAPKPLSMLTTETLGEQVFNIPSSAAMPPKEAP